MKEKIKIGMSLMKQRTRFIQGLAVGLFIMSAMTYAAVTLTTFTSGTPISSTDVNANFTALKAKVDQLDVGFIVGLSTNYTLANCHPNWSIGGASYEGLSGLSASFNDGNFNTSTGVYTVPANGLYRIFVDAPDTTLASEAGGYSVRLATSVDSGSTWTYENAMGSMNVVRKMAANTLIKVGVATYWKFPPNDCSVKPTVDAAKFSFALKQF